MFLGGICVFIIANIAAALAQTEIQLAIFRAFQGAAGAASIPSAVSILAHAFPATSPYRAIAFACFSAGAPIGSGFGSVFGGIFTQYSTWRTLFYFTAGVACIPLILGYFVAPLDRLDPARDKRVDYLGSLLVTAGLVLLLFALSSGPTAPQAWKTPYIIAFLVLSIVLLAAFVFWEHTIVHSPRFSLPPMLPLEIFTREKISLVLLTGFLIWASFQPFLLYTVLYYQQYLLLSPMNTMVRQLPTAVRYV
jgi:MFS family permease